MVGDNLNVLRYYSLSGLFFVCFLVAIIGIAVGFAYTAMPWNVTFASDKSSYACYPGCTAYINVTSNNATLNGTYNITFYNNGTVNLTNVNFTIYNCTSGFSSCTAAADNNLTNFQFNNGTVYPFKVEINMTEPLYGKWNFTLLMYNGTDWMNITFDPYIDSINLTYPANMSYLNDTQPQFNFTFTSAYNTTINCTLFLNSTTYPYGNVTAANASEENITANSTLSNTLYTWFVGCDSDDDGTADEFSAYRTVTIDNTTPSLSMNSPLNGTPIYQKNVSNYINFTVNFTYTELYPTLYWINITNSSGDCVHNVTNSTNITGGSSQVITQNISIDYSTEPNDGKYDIEVRMYDKAGNMNYSRENESLVIDSTLPVLSMNSPLNASPVYGKTVNSTINFTVNFSYTEANPASFLVRVLNSTGGLMHNVSNTTNITAGTDVTTTQNVSMSSVADGKYDIEVYMYDLAGNSNSTRDNQSLIIDNTAPVIVLNTSNNWWDEDGDSVVLNYTATDYSGFTNCSLWITNSSNRGWHLNMTNITSITNASMNNFTINGLDNSTNENGTYKWNVQCYDQEKNYAFASSNRTLYIGNRSDLIIYDIAISPSAPYVNQTFNATVTVKNIGTKSVTNVTNVSFVYGSYTNRTATVSTLAPGSTASVTYYGLTALAGNNSMTAVADYAVSGNGNWSMERSESNNTRVEYLSTYLNVTLMNVITYGSTVYPGDVVTLNLSVRLFNGTPLTGLDATNLTVYYDTYLGRIDWNRTDNITVFSGGAGGYYTLNYTIPLNSYTYKNYAVTARRVAEPGNHSSKIMITATHADGNYSGWANDTNIFSITAPKLEVELQGVKTALTYPSGNTDTIYVRTRNSGKEDIENITVYVQSNNSGYKVETTVNLYCYYNNTLPNSSTTWQTMTCNGNTVLDAEATALGTFRLSVIYAHGNSSVQQLNYNSTVLDYEVITVTNSSSSSSSTDDTSTSDTTTTDECDEDTDCATNYHCVGGTCLELSCPSGYTAFNHQCILNSYNYALKIMEITESLELTQGESGTIEFKVKNIGNVTSNVRINATSSLKGVDIPLAKGVYHILQPFMTYSSTADVNISYTSDIGTGNITFIAFDKDRTDVTAEYNISLTIQPNNETKVLLNATYDTYVKMLNEFLMDFRTINPAGVSPENYTKLNRSLVTVERMLNDIKSKLTSGDYLGANAILADVDAMLRDIEIQFANLQKEKDKIFAFAATDTTMWIIGIVIVIIVGALLVYLLLPSTSKGGYNIRAGYRPLGGGRRGGILNNIKEKLGSISFRKKGYNLQKGKYRSQRTIAQFKTSYMPGYERQSDIYSVYKHRNTLKKLKQLVKKR